MRRIASTRPAQAASLLKHVLVVCLVLLVAACSGGGCASCTSVTPLTDGFAADKRIENAGSARVTPSGLGFVQTNLGSLAQGLLGGSGAGGILTFDVPQTTENLSVVTATICPNGSDASADPKVCVAEVDLGNANLSLTTASPYDLHITGTMPLRIQDLQVSFSCATLNISINGDGACPGGTTFDALPVDVDIAIHVDNTSTQTAGYGYSAITINSILDESAAESNLSDSLHICGLPNCSGTCCITNICSCAVAGIASSLKSTLVSALYSQLSSALTTQIDNELCQTSSASSPCPAGTTADSGGICRYNGDPNNACASIQLGTSGHANLGALLGSISPGTVGGLDFVLAAGGADKNTNDSSGTLEWGDLDSVNGGATLGLLGGAEPSPVSECVPAAALTLPTGVPIPNELLGGADTIANWPAGVSGPDLELAVSARYINYALGNFYNSGGLCLGITTESFQELNSGTISLLAPSLKNLTFNGAAAPVAITTRPQTPPTVVLGGGTNDTTDPLLLVTLKQFAIDFYIWNDDRFIRAFTYTADLTIPVNLTIATTTADPNGALVPTLGTVVGANASVTNGELLLDSPAKIASGLTGLLGSLVGQLAGAINPIDLSSLTSSLGIALTIPSDPQVGLRKLTSGSDDFLAIFAGLSLPPAPQIHHVQPKAALTSKVVHAEAMALDTYDPAKLPSLHLALDAEGEDGAVEYAWWVDKGTRSPWTSERAPTVHDQSLFLQGKHTLFVTARRAGVPASEAESPVAVPYTIDVLPPTVSLNADASGVSLAAWDFVSATSALVARTRVADAKGRLGAWSEWDSLATVAARVVGVTGSALSVEVRDEEGNVADGELALIRGRNDTAAVAGACGCSTPGLKVGEASRGAALAFALFGVALVLLRRRPRRVASAEPTVRRGSWRGTPARQAAALALGVGAMTGATNQGCSCGGSSGVTLDAGEDAGDGGGTKRTDAAVDSGPSGTGCGSDCNQPCEPSLPPGWVGAYTSIAKGSDGTIWLAGYNEKAIVAGVTSPYGDLIVGKYDSSKEQVDWVSADGLPTVTAGTCPLNDPTGWRRGLTDPADDVGLWTSIQLDSNDNPIVSYYDVTNSALKFASSADGKTWTSHTVMQQVSSDIGRYSKLLVVKGVPVIAFLIIEPGTNGRVRSRVELATAMTATPSAASDWSFEDAATDDTAPCSAAFCASPLVCVTETGDCVAKSTACSADAGSACASTETCVAGVDGGAPSCGTPLASGTLSIYPNALGDYIAMAATTKTSNGVGIVVYDRLHGALVQLAKESGKWQETILDSESGVPAADTPANGVKPANTGDVGVGASLFITDDGDWHVSYVNGTTEALQYLMIPGGTGQPAAPEVVDDGYTLNGTPYKDGLHLVGDDSSLSVDSAGTITVTYQDATAGTLHVATGKPKAGGTHTWTVAAPTQSAEFAGYFSHAMPGDPTQVENFWISADPTALDVKANLTFLTP